MSVRLPPALLSVGLLLTFPVLLSAEEAGTAPDFAADVQPLLRKYCTGCHSADLKEGGLVLESFETLMKGGDNGAIVTAGDVDGSRIIAVLEGREELNMPPEGMEAPTAEERAVLKAWIKAGAKPPQGDAPLTLIVPTIMPTAPVREPIGAVAFSPDGNGIAVGGYGTVELLSADTRETLRTLDGPAGHVNDVGFSADGTMLFAAAGEPGLFG
ncbi:MAG: c-type cytochrome domain-containing protein, partial [Planctomycetaceae bacterium]